MLGYWTTNYCSYSVIIFIIIVIIQYSFVQKITVIHFQISDQHLPNKLVRRSPLLMKPFITSHEILAVGSLHTFKINKLFSLCCIIVDRKYVSSLCKALKDLSLEALVAAMMTMISLDG